MLKYLVVNSIEIESSFTHSITKFNGHYAYWSLLTQWERVADGLSEPAFLKPFVDLFCRIWCQREVVQATLPTTALEMKVADQ